MGKTIRIIILSLTFVCLNNSFLKAQEHSVARKWNEALLEAIRGDFARPTIHARNLFHTSVVLYDAWSAYESTSETFFLGKTVGGFNCPYGGVTIPQDVKAAQEEAMSYAAYRLLSHRFANSPSSEETQDIFDDLMDDLGYDRTVLSANYQVGGPASLGNYLAEQMIAFGLQDGSNEENGYTNLFYEPTNDPLVPTMSGNPEISHPNRWQPLAFDIFIDQGGNVVPGAVPNFLSPEWGRVVPFALKGSDLNVYNRDNNEYLVYHDPGDPPYLIEDTGGDLTEEYKWGFALVALWSSHLDPADGIMWDISPGAIGNFSAENLPNNFPDFRNFYDALNGGDPSTGRALNPVTGEPYAQQMVPRGDYGRVLAEFWADGPDSETPPGHWFTILNYVNDHPLLVKKFKGEGAVLDDLEWDVKIYLTLGGAMHDCAVTAWGIKGYYDYVRPISAIRYMADQGQSTDNTLSNYSPNGIPLEPGLIEIVEAGDPLVGENEEHLGKIKLKAWKGPDFINDPNTDVAGVDWILAENWWPYQRPSFITPPFAGYVSGHSTFSRAAAEVLTLFTGSEYFPGGIGEFVAPQNEFLVFEEGPSVDVTLQWATYRDASDQTSLSRIWGGIHPPADDIPGRHIGIEVGTDAFNLAEQYFTAQITSFEPNQKEIAIRAYPNPVNIGDAIKVDMISNRGTNVSLLGLNGVEVYKGYSEERQISVPTTNLKRGIYILRVTSRSINRNVVININ